MNNNQKNILDTFLKDYPLYSRAEWDGELIVYFAHKPNEPFTAAEFVEGSFTRKLLDHIDKLLDDAVDA